MKKRILVVGGAGYIGSFTASALVKAGYETVILDNLSAGHEKAVPRGAAFVRGDISDSSFLQKFLADQKVDGVIHFAAKTSVGDSVRDPIGYYRANVACTLNLIEAMVQNGVSYMVFSSTAATYGVPQGTLDESHQQQPINPYGDTKLAIEKLLRACATSGHMNSVALRYFNACGAAEDGSMGEDHDPETHLLPLVMKAALGQQQSITVFGEDYPTPDGTCIRDYIHVDDLASAHILALEALFDGRIKGFDAFNVGTGKGVSVKEVIEAVERVLGRKVPITKGERRAGDPPLLVADSKRLMSKLDWTPRYTDITEIVKTVESWMTRHPRGYAS